MQNIGECMRESGQLDSAYHYLDGALKTGRYYILYRLFIVLFGQYIYRKKTI